MKYDNTYYPDELYHHGIKGMKWGVRRFQKENGTMTNAGEKRYLGNGKRDKKIIKNRNSEQACFEDMKKAKNPGQFKKKYKIWDDTIKNEISKNEASGNLKEANSLKSKRALMKIKINQESAVSRMSAELANENPDIMKKFASGETYTWNLDGNKKLGGVDFTIDGHTATYDDNFKRIR